MSHSGFNQIFPNNKTDSLIRAEIQSGDYLSGHDGHDGGHRDPYQHAQERMVGFGGFSDDSQ